MAASDTSASDSRDTSDPEGGVGRSSLGDDDSSDSIESNQQRKKQPRRTYTPKRKVLMDTSSDESDGCKDNTNRLPARGKTPATKVAPTRRPVSQLWLYSETSSNESASSSSSYDETTSSSDDYMDDGSQQPDDTTQNGSGLSQHNQASPSQGPVLKRQRPGVVWTPPDDMTSEQLLEALKSPVPIYCEGQQQGVYALLLNLADKAATYAFSSRKCIIYTQYLLANSDYESTGKQVTPSDILKAAGREDETSHWSSQFVLGQDWLGMTAGVKMQSVQNRFKVYLQLLQDDHPFKVAMKEICTAVEQEADKRPKRRRSKWQLSDEDIPQEARDHSPGSGPDGTTGQAPGAGQPGVKRRKSGPKPGSNNAWKTQRATYTCISTGVFIERAKKLGLPALLDLLYTPLPVYYQYGSRRAYAIWPCFFKEVVGRAQVGPQRIYNRMWLCTDDGSYTPVQPYKEVSIGNLVEYLDGKHAKPPNFFWNVLLGRDMFGLSAGTNMNSTLRRFVALVQHEGMDEDFRAACRAAMDDGHLSYIQRFAIPRIGQLIHAMKQQMSNTSPSPEPPGLAPTPTGQQEGHGTAQNAAQFSPTTIKPEGGSYDEPGVGVADTSGNLWDTVQQYIRPDPGDTLPEPMRRKDKAISVNKFINRARLLDSSVILDTIKKPLRIYYKDNGKVVYALFVNMWPNLVQEASDERQRMKPRMIMCKDDTYEPIVPHVVPTTMELMRLVGTQINPKNAHFATHMSIGHPFLDLLPVGTPVAAVLLRVLSMMKYPDMDDEFKDDINRHIQLYLDHGRLPDNAMEDSGQRLAAEPEPRSYNIDYRPTSATGGVFSGASDEAVLAAPTKKAEAISVAALLTRVQRMDPADVIATLKTPCPVYGQKGDLRSYALFTNFFESVCSKAAAYNNYQVRPRLISCTDNSYAPDEPEEVVKVIDMMKRIGSFGATDYASVLCLGRELFGISEETKMGVVIKRLLRLVTCPDLHPDIKAVIQSLTNTNQVHKKKGKKSKKRRQVGGLEREDQDVDFSPAGTAHDTSSEGEAQMRTQNRRKKQSSGNADRRNRSTNNAKHSHSPDVEVIVVEDSSGTDIDDDPAAPESVQHEHASQAHEEDVKQDMHSTQTHAQEVETAPIFTQTAAHEQGDVKEEFDAAHPAATSGSHDRAVDRTTANGTNMYGSTDQRDDIADDADECKDLDPRDALPSFHDQQPGDMNARWDASPTYGLHQFTGHETDQQHRNNSNIQNEDAEMVKPENEADIQPGTTTLLSSGQDIDPTAQQHTFETPSRMYHHSSQVQPMHGQAHSFEQQQPGNIALHGIVHGNEQFAVGIQGSHYPHRTPAQTVNARACESDVKPDVQPDEFVHEAGTSRAGRQGHAYQDIRDVTAATAPAGNAHFHTDTVAPAATEPSQLVDTDVLVYVEDLNGSQIHARWVNHVEYMNGSETEPFCFMCSDDRYILVPDENNICTLLDLALAAGHNEELYGPGSWAFVVQLGAEVNGYPPGTPVHVLLGNK